MKQWLMLALLAVFAVAAAPVNAQEFEEGVHYEVIADQGTSEPEVMEFFSFYCVHCYRFEPIAQQMKARFGEAFDKAHVSFINPQNMGSTMSRAFAAAKMLEVESQVSSAIFDKNFNQQDMLLSKDALRDIFVTYGVSGADFDKAMASFSVRGMANKYDREASKYGVNATPTFIVNGKYKLLPQGFSDSEDFITDFVAATGYLLEKE